MSESMLRRILRDHQARRRSIALILCLSMVVSLGVFSGLRKDAVAKTYTRVVLECPYMADDAAQVVHTHNDDCYDEVGNLVCTLPELEAHTHGDECYTEVRTLVCGLEENPGHVHTDACYTAETTLVCGLEENEGHQHTGDCYTLERGELLCDNTDEEHEHTDDCYVWNEVLSCGMEAGEGAHLHSEDCYRTEWILTCGMEEGEGAHVHTDECYLTDRVLTCDKPEIILHTHTDDCYQKNDDGSIYVDEDGYSWLICGQPEIIEHVHDENCFKVYELDDGEPEETAAGEEIITADETAGEQAETEGTNETEPTITEAENTDEAEDTEEKTDSKDTAELNENEENKEETKDETKEENESTDTETEVPVVPMPAQSFEKTAGGIRVSVEAPEGAFPENTRMSVRPVNGSGLVDTVSDAVNGEILEVQAVDITFYDADDNEIEPATAIRVSIVPANSQYSEEKANVVHIDSEGAATAVEQAEGTTEDNSEVVFDADSFSIYAIVYTVHFEYEVDGQVYTSSVPGAQDKLLSELIRELNVVAEEQFADFMGKIAEVGISNPEVLKITETEGDWSIRPLKDSEEEEALTIVMQDGATFRITVDAEGITEVRTEDETAVIRTVNDLYLPQDATAVARVLTEDEVGNAIAAVQQAAVPTEENDPENADEAVDAGSNYHAFSIGLENVDVENYDGFNVSVTLPEDVVVGRDFQLFQVQKDGSATEITETLELNSERDEDGLQAVSELSFTTDSFADYVLSYSIETYYTTYEGDSLKISLNYGPKAGIPEGAELKVREILPEDESYSDYLNDSVTEIGVKSGAIAFARFLDIEIQKDGEKIEPLAPISVKIQMMDLPEETGNAEAQVIHFGEQTEVLAAEAVGTDVSFETGSFSVYGVLYTVDFHYEINGKTVEFSIPGGGFVSLEHVVEVLGLATADENTGNGAENAENGTENGNDFVGEVPGVDVDGENGTAYEEAIKLNEVEVSEATKKYVADVEGVEFSSPELVWVGKVDAESTVGGLKEANGLEVEYSAELTEEQIAEINAQTVEAGDWALISVQPFTTEETLTVAMKDGDQFVVKVTDAVKGTIIADDPVSGKAYAIIVKKDGKYYSVFNDGTLRSVEGAYNPETNKIDVEMDYPLLWNYTSGHVAAHSEGEWWQPLWERYPDHDFDYTNLSIPAEASGFYENHLPNGYYNRYIDPTASDGTNDENKTNSDLRESCTINYSNNHISSGNNYIGISSDGLHIIGNVTETNAAEIYLAETTVPNPDNDTHNDHMVNHIDISIDGASEIRIPLAYGDYQNSNGTTIFTSSEANHFITVTPDISISTNDMKNAVITASAIVDGERKELDDVFYVTGYSQNDKTNQDAKDQLRIEGSFKVSNIPYADNADNRTEICEARKANPIDYSVTVTKTVPVTVKHNGQELYADGQKLVFNVPISLTASFNYWQDTNKCPPLHVNYNENGPFNQDWIDGKIMGGTGPAMSGMDFDLAAAAAGSSSKPAIEINKIVQKEDGSYLTTTTAHDVGIEVYYKEKTSGEEDNLIGVGVGEAVDPGNLSGLSSGYMKLHNKDLPVGTSGIGAIYDYDVQPGLIYIKEDPSKVEQYLIGTDGKTYQYVSSRMETEYAWRTNGDEGKIHHADGTTSVPEVLGPYAYNGNNLNNNFLPFYIYNVYKEIETVDIPVDKSWPELGDGYTWSATFALQEIEVHESGPVRTDANTSHWVNVEDAGTITIHNGDSEADRTFSNLPKYRYYKNENGEDSVYRIIYSVDELEYELKHNGTTVSKWDKDHGLTVGEDIYAPQFPHDAGDSNDEMHLSESDPLFYHVIVKNYKSDVDVRKELTNLKIQKTWEEGALESAGVDESEANAVFHLRRYETKTYHEYDPELYDGSDCVVRLYDQNNNLAQSMTVKKGAKMKVVVTFSSNGAIHYMINNSKTDDLQLQWYSGNSTVGSASFTVSGDTEIKKYIHLWDEQPEAWTGEVRESHLEYYSADGSEVADDTAFANEKHYYPVNHGNGWHQTIDSLPLMAESSVHEGHQTIYTYSYYFVEVSSNPSGFYAEFTDGHGNPIGDAAHQITQDNTTVQALNKKIPPFAVEKKWYSVEDPDSYPEIRFTLYQGRINNGKVEQGTVFVDGNGKRYEDIPLNSKNHWHWDCPAYLPDTDASGNPVGYYIMEKTSDNNSGHVLLYQNSTLDEKGFIAENGEGALINPGIGEKYDVKPLDYYNDKNDNHAKTNDQNFPNGWNGGIAGNEGTLTVLNRTSKYMQMDIKKKILQVDPADGHVDTIMDEPGKMKDIVLEIQLKRLVFDATTGQQISTDWENYGFPFMIGFDSNNVPIMDNPNNFVLVKQGGFFWRIVLNTTEADQYGYAQNVGLPAYGYYTKDDGTIIPVRYRYIPFEIGVYSDLDKTPARPEFEWFAGLQPAAWDGNGSQVDTFDPILPNHDQDRIKNIQASDLYVEKVWEELPTNIQEIYVKLYRSRGESDEREDVTADIAKRTETFSGYGFVEDPSYLTTSVQGGVLVIKPETGEIHLHGLPLVYDTDNYQSKPYYYWVEEVGYKDVKGNVYTDTAKFYPLYDKWDSSTGTWSEWTTTGKEAASSLGQVSRNRIRANNAPTIDVKVQKKWVDKNGNELEAPWDSSITSISFSVKRVAQKYTRSSVEDEWTAVGEPVEEELRFDNGSTSGNTITVTASGQRAQVAVKQTGGTEYSISYMSDADDPEEIGSWATVVDGLQKSHVESETIKWAYTYSITEVNPVGSCEVVGNPISQSGQTVTIKNTETSGVPLRLKKQVTVNDFDPANSSVTDKTVADGTYVINVDGKAGTATGGKSYTAKITITNGVAVSATLKDNTVSGASDTPVDLTDGVLEIPDLIPGEYTVTEAEDSKTVLTAINSSDDGATADLDNRKLTITLNGNTGSVQLVTLTNNYADNSETDIAHISVRKTFVGLKQGMTLPEGFNIKVKVTATIDASQEEFNYTLTGATDTSNGVIWNQSVNADGDIVWEWKISIRGLNPDATVEVQEYNYTLPGYDVTPSSNPSMQGGDGTSYQGTVSSSTTVASIATVITQQNSLVFPLEDKGTEQTIFIARIIPSQTSLVISRNKLNLSERAALEAELHHMPNAQDWYKNTPPLYYSFEEAANGQIVVRNSSTVTYFERDGKGYIRFDKKAQWNMVASRKIIYVEGRPADFNFENRYVEKGIGIDIVKVDKDQPTIKLPEAKFTLTLLDETTTPAQIVYKKQAGTEVPEKQIVSNATNNNGETSFANLTSGFYEIKETQLPAGYVLTGDGCFYVKIADGVASYLAVPEDKTKPITAWTVITQTESTDLIQVTVGRADDPATPNVDETKNTLFSVGNTPGKPLPMTGGVGTGLFTALGGIMTATAGAILTMTTCRRRKIQVS